MRHDIVEVLSALRTPSQILVLGEDEHDRDLAGSLAALLPGQVDLGVADGHAAARLAPRERAAGTVGDVRTIVAPRWNFWETHRLGHYDALVLRGLERRFDPLEVLVHARTLDVDLLCVEAGVLPGRGKARLPARDLPPAARRALAARIDSDPGSRPAGRRDSADPAAEWRWFMTSAAIHDLLARAGWHVFREMRSATWCGRFFLCARQPAAAQGEPMAQPGPEAGA